MRYILWLALSSIAFGQVNGPPVPRSWSTGTPVEIPSGGVKINGMFFQGAGKGVRPTVIYFHGLPGYAGDLDLPVPISKAGWSVLTLHYRGSWGNPGEYSYAHQLEDATAAIAFVRKMGARRIVLVGHSTGGLIAMITAAGTPKIEGLVLISASDDSAEALIQYKTDDARAALRNGKGTPCSPPLAGCTSGSLDLETIDQAGAWTFAALAPKLTKIPILMITADDPYAPENVGLASAIVAHGGKTPEQLHLKTDHGYTTQKAALADAVTGWLKKRR